MRKLPLSKVYELIEPGPVVLVTTFSKGRADVMTMSWHMMVEFEPPMIACVLSEGNDSFETLMATRECVIAIPQARLLRKVVGIGNTHGSKVDKFKKFHLATLAARKVGAPLIADCFANLECRVVDATLVRRYNLFILEVLQAHIDPAQRNPKTLHHCGYGKFVVDGKRVSVPSRMR